jgi:hypothetical protein
MGVATISKAIYSFLEMVRAINIIAALLCLVCVLIICIAPFADLPETIVQPLQLAILLMLAFVAGMFLHAGILCITVLRLMLPAGCLTSPTSFLLRPIDANCVQQC